MIEIVEPAPVALSKTEWNAVRRCAEAAARRDHGLALALATLFRYADPRISEVAALQIPDVQVSARRGLLIIRRGKGLKHREIALIQEAREPLDTSFHRREHLAERMVNKALEYISWCEEMDFHEIKVSLKVRMIAGIILDIESSVLSAFRIPFICVEIR